MTSKIQRYFTEANSANGLVSLLNDNLKDIENIYTLSQGSLLMEANIIESLTKHFNAQDCDLELIYSVIAPELATGLIVRNRGIAVLGSEHDFKCKAKIHRIDLRFTFDLEMLNECKQELNRHHNTQQKNLKTMHSYYQKGLRIHDEWEAIYINAIDRQRAENFRDLVLQTYLDAPKVDKKPTLVRRFFGASVPGGLTDFIEDLTGDLKERYFIKGRPGTGKSTLLKAINKRAQDLGYSTEIYHCSFDPKSLDMVLIPELEICFFDATAPHEYEPIREGDKILDTYNAFIEPDTDEDNEAFLSDVTARYTEAVSSGLHALELATTATHDINKIYEKATNWEKFDQVCEDLKAQMT